jgi:hypothetical protein
VRVVVHFFSSWKHQQSILLTDRQLEIQFCGKNSATKVQSAVVFFLQQQLGCCHGDIHALLCSRSIMQRLLGEMRHRRGTQSGQMLTQNTGLFHKVLFQNIDASVFFSILPLSSSSSFKGIDVVLHYSSTTHEPPSSCRRHFIYVAI